ncbi:hypothetical protein CN380_20560 [Bacillus sp. AFS017274]|nr:hypothetical protein CN380_20560 [Bacillus sp. AFS017274]
MLSFIIVPLYIFENGDISSKTPDLSTNYMIYRFFDKNSLYKSYFLIEMQRNCQKKYQKILIRIVKLC